MRKREKREKNTWASDNNKQQQQTNNKLSYIHFVDQLKTSTMPDINIFDFWLAQKLNPDAKISSADALNNKTIHPDILNGKNPKKKNVPWWSIIDGKCMANHELP